MKIRIQNFQPFADTGFLTVEGLTVIIGASNRGKSAFVRAVEGALFNRPGDGCIRTGAKAAVVTITDLPQLPAASLVWTKARSTTYALDGETYGKLSGDTPPILQEAGYRDLWVGDKDRKKGEYLRPQVAGQFDPLFLLTRSGAFVADVLQLVTRQHVLMTAQDRCAADLRSVTQRIGLQTSAREQAETQLAAVADVPAILQHVTALQARATTLAQLRARQQALLVALTQRIAAREVLQGLMLALALPPAGPAWGRFARHLRTIQTARTRQAVAAVCGALPAQAPSDRLVALTTRRGQVGALLAARRAAELVPQSMPAAHGYPVPLDEAVRLRDRVAVLRRSQEHALLAVRQRTAAAEAATVEVEQVEGQLHAALDALGVCPLCEQVMPHAQPAPQST